MRKYTIVFFLLITACQSGRPQDYLKLYDIAPPTQDHFTHCFNYGCQTKAAVKLPDTTKKKLNRIFTPAPQTKEEEQKAIAKSIGALETDIGRLTGTKNDKYGTFRLYQDNAKTTRSFQQDCIDESTNTTIYLMLLSEMGFLKFHKPVFPANRQPFTGGGAWWHQSAVMEDLENGNQYAVDSWFRDNGHDAYIVPLSAWKKGWRPPEQKK